jgi:hypothetical protein
VTQLKVGTLLVGETARHIFNSRIQSILSDGLARIAPLFSEALAKNGALINGVLFQTY